jgi:GAF domain-containing protein
VLWPRETPWSWRSSDARGHEGQAGVGHASSGLQEVFRRLASLRFEEESLETTLAFIVSVASHAMGSADGTGVMVVRTASLATIGASSEQCQQMNSVQSESGRGPSLLAIRSAAIVDARVGPSCESWPEFTKAARESGFGAVLAVPMVSRQRVIGSLSLFSRRNDGFDGRTTERAQMLSDQVAIVVQNASAFATANLINQQLEEALKSRDVIGVAKGILMERYSCGDKDAFDLLRQESQTTHRKLRDVASSITASRDCADRGPRGRRSSHTAGWRNGDRG